jgi:hypothetical protein
VGKRTEGDLMFERYLFERGFDVPEHEPDLGIRVRPEYLLTCGSATCLTEVKEFAVDSWPIRQGFNSQQEVLRPIRRQIHEAARKLRSAKNLGHPLVAVLTDPHRALFGLLEPREVIAAIRGDMTIVVPLGGHADQATLVNGRNGELSNNHPYVSAVLVVHDLGDGAYRCSGAAPRATRSGVA